MTKPVVPIDTGNQLLTEVPAQMSCVPLPTAAGQRLALTIRTGSTTLTVFLGKEDAKAWHASMGGAIQKMTGLVVAQPGTKIPPFKPNPRQQKG